MKATDHGFLLSSGREFYAHAHLLSVADGDRQLFYGYDGDARPNGGGDFTAQERREIAEYMIARWKKWGER